jgi:hypothetical protein
MAKYELLKELLAQSESVKSPQVLLEQLSIALEHHTYKNIPGTSNSFRQDSANTNTGTQKHAHVYAKRNGQGKELYSVNLDGRGHDGSSGTKIPLTHAEHFRGLGYSIPLNLTLESLEYDALNSEEFEICILEDDA